jgi:hypothetical protein
VAAAVILDLVTSPAVVAIFVALSWVSSAALVLAARRATPRVGALTERANIAVLISIALTIFVVIAANADVGYPLWDQITGRRLLRLTILTVSLIGPSWLYLWLTGRLGDRP